MTANPLKSYFRQPTIYLKLPSKGEFWRQGTLNMPPTGELPILPMTGTDEITIKTPDALMNGEATVKVIESCVPSIKDAWATPSIDLDALLIAIRIASYGHEMELTVTCPCEKKVTQDYVVDLRTILDQLASHEFDGTLHLENGLILNIKPLDYKTNSQNGLKVWEQNKLMQTVNDSTLTEEVKIQKFNESFQNLIKLTFELVSNSVQSVTTPDGVSVSNISHVKEFLAEADRSIIEHIERHFEDQKKKMELKPLSIKCSECDQTFERTIEFDQVNFFAKRS